MEVDSCVFKGRRGIDIINFEHSSLSSYTAILDTLIIKNNVFEGFNEGISRQPNRGASSYILLQNNLIKIKEPTITYLRFFTLDCRSKITALNNILYDVNLILSGSENSVSGNNVLVNCIMSLNGKWTVAHNTIYNGRIIGTYTTFDSKQFNNCIADFTDYPNSPLGDLDKSKIPTFFSDYNLYYSKPPIPVLYNFPCMGNYLNSFREQLTCFGMDEHSFISENPRFISNIDLRPDTTQNTPLSNSGLIVQNIPELAFDINGRPRNLFRPDIGAYEVGGSNSPNIWAGDANDDGIVNNQDLFTVGVAIPKNFTGIVRINPTIEWKAQMSTDWADKISGINAKHADCNGDGVISTTDATAINRNFGQIHLNFKSENPVQLSTRNALNIPIYFSGLPDSLSFANEVTGYINFGNASLPANNIYGLAYSFLIDTNRILPNSFKMEFDSCWIGKINSNLLSNVAKNNSGTSVEIGIIRIDGNNISGQGKIGKFTFKLKESSIKDLGIALKNVLITDKNNALSELTTEIQTVLPIRIPSLNINYAPNSLQSYSVKVTQSFNQRIGIKVTNATTGIPLKDVKVSFSLPLSGASAMFSENTTLKTVETNADGIAQVDLGNANSIAGNYFVTVQVVGQNQTIKFILTNKPSDVSTMKITEGSNQKTNINMPFEKPLTLKLSDTYNNPIEGEIIKFSNYPSNNSALSPNAIWVDSSSLNIRYTKTDSNGIGSIRVKANQYDGTYVSVYAAHNSQIVYYSLTNIDPLKTAITTIEDSSSWLLSPNPTSGIVTIKNSSPSVGFKNCKVYDSAGIVRGSFQNLDNQPIMAIDLRYLESGYYIIELTTEKIKTHKKIVIQRD